MIIVTALVRLVLLVLYISDIIMLRRMRKKDTTLKRMLSKSQEFMKVAFHFIVMTGLLTPFEPIFILLTLAVIIFFFIFTDREVYVNMHAMYFRARYYEFKKIKNFTYQNKTFDFDYNNEHITLNKPFLEEGFILREIVHKVEKAAAKQELKAKRNK